MPVANVIGTWTRLMAAGRLRRSSQILNVIDEAVYIFSGEVQARLPVDNQVDILSLAPDATKLEIKSTPTAPIPRVGSASAVLNGKMFLFSGRGGLDMAPIEEYGALWCYDPAQNSWSRLDPADSSKPYPPARSYHCAASDGDSSLSFLSWTQAADAPAPQRGGTSIAYSDGKLYRMNGFDGTTEQGGHIDIYDVASNTWATESFPADGNAGPKARSVCTLLPIRLQGKTKLITLFGERDPSSLGHAGAGKMLDDVWVYDIGENWWTRIQPKGIDGFPDPRGWFAADVIKGRDGRDSVLIHGGLGENNERLTDAWVLNF